MKYSFLSQSAGLTSVVNFRQLGGYVLPDGSRIRQNVLLRGGAFNNLSDADALILEREFRLVVNFDFRTEGETLRMPDREVRGCKRVWLPAIDPSTEQMATMQLPKEAYANLPRYLVQNASNPLVQDIAMRLYTDMVVNEYTQLQYAAFLQTILTVPDGAVYWHCSQGKDRTGLGSAFLLAALGADRQLILEDFNISADYYREEFEAVCAMIDGDRERKVVRTFISANEEYFIDALNLIDRRYGSLDDYVRDVLLLSDEDRKILRSRYLE